MKKLSPWFVALVALVFVAVACGEVPTSDSHQEGPTALPTEDPHLSDVPRQAVPLVQLAIDHLLEQNSSIDRSGIDVFLVEETEWPSSCLGCPQEGTMCLDVITPGYRVILRVDDTNYEYHTDMDSTVVFCPEEAGGPGMGESNRQVDMVVEDLAAQLPIASEEIRVVRVEQVDWSDSSLGCPQEGQAYLTVITPGYHIILEAGGVQYDYRTDMGSNFILCEQ